MVGEAVAVSVIIPSLGQSPKLARWLEDLSRQRCAPAEVLLGLDGATADEAD